MVKLHFINNPIINLYLKLQFKNEYFPKKYDFKLKLF